MFYFIRLRLSCTGNECLRHDLYHSVIFFITNVCNRLHIQGTRTIIDNLDTGSSVIPILTRYDGFFDCWNTITREEGYWGLYKGFGALVLQYALQLSIIKGSIFTLQHVGDLLKSTTPSPPTTVLQGSPNPRNNPLSASPVACASPPRPRYAFDESL